MLPSEARIGMVVYPAYTPSAAGVIVEIGEKSPRYPSGYVVIETPTGKRHTTVVCNRYEDLVDDHQRKLNKHQVTLEQLRRFAETMYGATR
jgi:hypothetical protein